MPNQKPKVKVKFAHAAVKDKNGIVYRPDQMFSSLEEISSRYPPSQGWKVLAYPAVLDNRGQIELTIDDQR